MIKALRVTLLVLVSFLLQTTIMTHLKIGGVMIDVMTIAIYTIGYAYGSYFGIMAGMGLSLIIEAIGGDPGGLSLAYVAVGFFGAWVVQRMRDFTLVGNRTLEYNIKRFAPLALLAVAGIIKEAVYLVYFYLTGMDISFRHVLRMLFVGLITGAAGLVLLPLLFRFLRPKPKDTMKKEVRQRRVKTVPMDADGIPQEEGKRKKKPRQDKTDKTKPAGKKEKGQKLKPESFLSLLNPVLDAGTAEPEEDDEEEIERTPKKKPVKGKKKKKEIDLTQFTEYDPDAEDERIEMYKRPAMKPPVKQDTAEEEHDLFRRPGQEPPETDPPEDDPPKGGMDP